MPGASSLAAFGEVIHPSREPYSAGRLERNDGEFSSYVEDLIELNKYFGGSRLYSRLLLLGFVHGLIA